MCRQHPYWILAFTILCGLASCRSNDHLANGFDMENTEKKRALCVEPNATAGDNSFAFRYINLSAIDHRVDNCSHSTTS